MDPSFAPPQPAGPTPGRPGAPKVFGVLSIIFGSVVLLFSLLGSCSQLAQKNQGQLTSALMGIGGDAKGTAAAWDKYLSTTRTVSLAQSAIFILLSGGLLMIGIGQLRYRRWARSSSVYWGIAGLVVLAVVILVNRLIVAPAGRELFDTLASSSKGFESMMGSMMGSIFTSSWFMIVTVILYAPYPLLLLLYFTRPAIRDAMVD